MNKLVLSLGNGFKENPIDEIKMLHEVGWDGFFSGWYQGENLEAYAKLADELGMFYQSVHAPFGNVDTLWDSVELGDKYADEQIECLRQTKSAGVDLVVVHAIIGMEKCTPTALGLKRFERIFNAAENFQ